MSIQSKNFMKEIEKYLECYTYDISIVIVNYNGRKYLEKLFESLNNLQHKDFTFEVVFVDNNSADDSVDYLKELKKSLNFDLNIVESKTNRGFAGGNNLGGKRAQGEYVVLLNNDTVVDSKWLEELYYCIRDKKSIVMVNSKMLFYYDFIKLDMPKAQETKINRIIKLCGQEYAIEDKYCKNFKEQDGVLICNEETQICIPIWNEKEDFVAELMLDGKNEVLTIKADEIAQKKVSLIQNAGSGVNEAYDGYDIGSGEIDSEKFSQPYRINNACGASVIMRRDDFYKVGMFDSRFFMYYEDTDLSYRLKKKAKNDEKDKDIMYCPSSIVRHIHTGSSKEWSPLFTYHVYRNKLLFVFKNISKTIYFKQLFALYRQAKRENNFYKLCGCKDSLKIILKMKTNTSFRW